MPTQLENILQQLSTIQQWMDSVVTNKKEIHQFNATDVLAGENFMPISIDGLTKKVSLNLLTSFINQNNLFRENNYDDIADMLANQGEQTEGKVQFVADASGDPDIVDGYAYYEKLASLTADLIDYRRLTSDEASLLDGNTSYRTFQVKNITASLPTLSTIGQVILEKDGSNNITAILFDINFSKYLKRYASLFASGVPVYASIPNKTQPGTLIATVSAFAYTIAGTGSDYYKVSLNAGITTDDVAIADFVEVFLDIDVLGEDIDLSLYQLKSEKGAVDGYASLDGTGKVPAAQLPSYVDDVLEAANYGALPVTGETGKIYVTIDTNQSYRWTGSIYVKVSDFDLAGAINGATDKPTPVGADKIGIWDSVSGLLRALTFTNLVAYLSTLYRPLYDRLITNATVTGAYDIDWSAAETWRLTLTGNTTFTHSNIPPSNKTKTITLEMDGNFAPTWPTHWSTYKTGTYNGAKFNTVTVEFITSTVIKVQIVQND